MQKESKGEVLGLRKELDKLQEALRGAEKEKGAAGKERELLASKLERLEKSSVAEKAALSAEMSGQLSAAKAKVAELEARVAELRQQLAEKEAAEMAVRASEKRIREVEAELEELRDMKENVERRQKQDAERMAGQAKRIQELEKTYKEEQVLRKKYWNQIQDASGKIRVYARTRPMNGRETEGKMGNVVEFPDEYTVKIPGKGPDDKPREFPFDYCFAGDSTQESVFGEVKSLIQSSVDGYNVCIFAYGQTGSGKTFTINGPEAAPGIVPRSLKELFQIARKLSGRATFIIKTYMLELYQDKLIDLLYNSEHPSAKPPTLDVKKDPKGWVTVQNATVRPVTNHDELSEVFNEGMARRRIAHTAMNTESSRSHLIFSIIIEATDLQTQSVTKGKLSFVDLAGSERLKKSKSEGEQMKEAQAINSSLSALGDVISALATDQPHIPYRNHKLTMLMSDSLGGNAKTLMFVNVSPADGNLDETVNSLQYATRVRTIKNDPKKEVANKEMLKLKDQIKFWRDKAATAKAPPAEDLVEIPDARQ